MGISTGDDAGVFALGDGRVLVQTVDIFAPVVDDPYTWGRIAAANSLSDIYAMGATPLTALQYLAWPRDKLSLDIASEVIEGGMGVMADAGCTVVGGHSIDGAEPHYGLAVTGIAPEGGIVTNAGARTGDSLVLTKPLGTGIVSTAIKRGECPPEVAGEAISTMAKLNDVAGAALDLAHAATDVSGFGFLGHLGEMLDASDVGADIILDDVPLLTGVTELAKKGMWSEGSARNWRAVRDSVESSFPDHRLKLLADAQTSGGLLVALDDSAVDAYLERVPGAVVVGRLTSEKSIGVA